MEDFVALIPEGQKADLIDGRYDLAPLEQNRIFRSDVLEGFWLDVE